MMSGQFLRSVVLAGAAATLLAVVPEGASAQTVDGPKVTWKVGTWGKRRAVTEGMELLAAHVKERTGGKFTMTIGYEAFGAPKELLDVLSVGGIEATMICSSYHPDKQQAYTGLDLPFLPITDFDTQWRVHEAYHKHPYIQQEMGKWNAMFYASNLLPQYEFIGKTKPPRTLADFKGMRVRAIGGIGQAMRNLGAVPTSVDATEVYTSMERGTVDAASFPSTYAHVSYKIYEVGKWYTMNMSPGTQACPTLINKDAWAKLPDAYKPLFDEIKPRYKEVLVKGYADADAKAIPLFKQKKLELITYSEQDLQEFRKIGAQPVWDKWVEDMSAKGIPAKELLDLIMKTAADGQKKS
jgi:TRAP-type C4-dicarboxylate transport system substrate-binding protein